MRLTVQCRNGSIVVRRLPLFEAMSGLDDLIAVLLAVAKGVELHVDLVAEERDDGAGHPLMAVEER